MNQIRIEDLLHRRTDLSTFLVHFTKADGHGTACENLKSIIESGCLEAVTKQGMAKDKEIAGQAVVCFTETPLEQAWTLLEEIEGREVKLEPYGLVFTKIWARRKRVNPVWYIDATPGQDWLTNTINEMIGHDVDCNNNDGNPTTGSILRTNGNLDD